ncbi:MAG: flagellar assembly protein H [Acidobacteria bacterium]|nr:flagellar assembly protein H [Acidobacteriota bacterium]
MARPVPPIDHDQFFKELLTTFFVEFLELFFPALAAGIEPGQVEFVRQEVFARHLRGRKLETDVLAKVRFAGRDAFFLVHVEHQSTVEVRFPARLYLYSAVLFEKYGLPIYPIVVFSHDRPLTPQPDEVRMEFPDGFTQVFRYRVVQLNRLPWRAFVRRKNPVASALMAKMKIEEKDRLKVKLECLRLMVTLKLDPGRMEMIATFVDAYLRLNEVETKDFGRELGRMRISPLERDEMLNYVTSWEEKGIAIGRKEGLEAGRQEGRLEGRQEGLAALRETAVAVVSARFGEVPARLAKRIRALKSSEEIQDFVRRAVVAAKLSDLS